MPSRPWRRCSPIREACCRSSACRSCSQASPPALLGRLTVGFFLDDRRATQLKAVTGSEIAFAANGRVLSASLPPEARAPLARLIDARDVTEVELGGERYMMVARPLQGSRGGPHAERRLAHDADSARAVRPRALPGYGSHGSRRRAGGRAPAGHGAQLPRGAHGDASVVGRDLGHARGGGHRRPDAPRRGAGARLGGRGRAAAGERLQHADRIDRLVPAPGGSARAAVVAGTAVHRGGARDPQSADDHPRLAGRASRLGVERRGARSRVGHRRGDASAEPAGHRGPGLRQAGAVRPGRGQPERGVPRLGGRGVGRGRAARSRPRPRSGAATDDDRRRTAAHRAHQHPGQRPSCGRGVRERQRRAARRRPARGREDGPLGRARPDHDLRRRRGHRRRRAASTSSTRTSRRAAPARVSASRSPRTSSRAWAAASWCAASATSAPTCASTCPCGRREAPHDGGPRVDPARRRRREDPQAAGPRPQGGRPRRGARRERARRDARDGGAPVRPGGRGQPDAGHVGARHGARGDGVVDGQPSGRSWC